MSWDWKFSNLVSLLFLGFALFLYFQFHTYPSPSSPLHIDNMAEDASPESIYDFTVKIWEFTGRGVHQQVRYYTRLRLYFPSLPRDLRVHKVGASRVASTGISHECGTWFLKRKLMARLCLFRHFEALSLCELIRTVSRDIRGNDVSLSEYKGKVVLIVNVASKCGLTQSNYKELNVLYEKYKNQGFEILAFPCNQFGGQEPGTNEQIQEATCSMFKAEFPIFDKVEVNGKNAAPLYRFLKSEKGGYFGDAIKWNFTKFLVNKEGKVVERYAPTTSPLNIE
ncbi:hypothetical protein Goshw_020587, partial [Gossypium schwendimanii]|nr:hypothetical protein [Gossypium schwendimanii]